MMKVTMLMKRMPMKISLTSGGGSVNGLWGDKYYCDID